MTLQEETLAYFMLKIEFNYAKLQILMSALLNSPDILSKKIIAYIINEWSLENYDRNKDFKEFSS